MTAETDRWMRHLRRRTAAAGDITVTELPVGVADARAAASSVVALSSRAATVLVTRPLGPDPQRHAEAVRNTAALLRDAGAPPTFAGVIGPAAARAGLAIVEPPTVRRVIPVPEDFHVTAILWAYNEADVIGPSIAKLLAGGIDVHLLDNWSQDETAALAVRAAAGSTRLTVERFPPDGPPTSFAQWPILRRAEEIAAKTGGWVVLQSADEVRCSPWPGVGLREGLHRVHQRGYDAIDFGVVNFRPVDDDFRPGSDFEAYFRHFEFEVRSSGLPQISAWNADRGRAAVAPSGGHDATFDGRRLFPYRFLLKHYPVRSQAHGRRKVLSERLARYDDAERARGWHRHYDHITAETCFVRDASELEVFDADFAERHLTSRLLGPGGDVAAPGRLKAIPQRIRRRMRAW
jgi:hypothetical protein